MKRRAHSESGGSCYNKKPRTTPDKKFSSDEHETVKTYVDKTFKRKPFKYDDSSDYSTSSYMRSLSPDSNSYTQQWCYDQDKRKRAQETHEAEQDKAYQDALKEEHAKREAKYGHTKDHKDRILVVSLCNPTAVYTASSSSLTVGAINALIDPDASEKEKAELEVSRYGWIKLPSIMLMDLESRNISRVMISNLKI